MPESFFHYFSLDTDDRRSWLERLLVKNEAYFRSRNQLNDPNELRPEIVFDGPEKAMRLFVRELVQQRSGRLSLAKRLQEERKVMHIYKNPEQLRKMLHDILDRLGIFCLSETDNEMLLWSHYADAHRGVCIEFDTKVGFLAAARQVTYGDKRPIVNRLVDSLIEIGEKSMLSKLKAWAYEREWRIIARWRDEERIRRFIAQHNVSAHVQAFMLAQNGPGYYSFPSKAIRSVILGARVTPAIEAWLRGAIEGLPKPIVLKRAVIARDGKLTIETARLAW